MCRRANQIGWMTFVALALILSFSGLARAGSVNFTTDIGFQPLPTDMDIASFDAGFGTDPAGVLNYGGTFGQTGWTSHIWRGLSGAAHHW
jgi:hypothetical protein